MLLVYLPNTLRINPQIPRTEEGEGEEELPPGSAEKTLRVKLQSTEFPGIVYCFSFAKYASGDAYCYELLSGRTVKLPAALTVLIVGENG